MPSTGSNGTVPDANKQSVRTGCCYFDALFRQFRVQYLSDQRDTPPQPVPALVSAFSAATVWQPC